MLPEGWDIERIEKYVSNGPSTVFDPQPFWHKDFKPVACDNLEQFGAYMGRGSTMQIRTAQEEGRDLILILSVGPMGMYRWLVYFLKEWNIKYDHVHGF